MNLMSNARLFRDDLVENKRNDLMLVDMLPQVKFNMMGQIQQHEMKKSPSSPYSSSLSSNSSSSSAPSPQTNATRGSSPPPPPPPTRSRLDKSDESGFRRDSSVQRRPGRTLGRFQEDSSPHHPSSRDSPLDFSNKKHKYDKPDQFGTGGGGGGGVKVKGSKKHGHKISQENESSKGEDPPSSRLRHILKMKSPVSPPVFFKDLSAGTVLNLSKDSTSPDWSQFRNNTTTTTTTRTSSNNSSCSLSPNDMDIHSSSSFIPSPRPPTIPGDGPPVGPTYPFSFSSTMAQSLGLSPYSVFNPNLSPMSHLAPTPFDPSMFQQQGGEVTGNFGTVPPSGSPSNSSAGAPKSRVTRPFKAYPKDPLTFPTVGLYGIPTAGPTPGVSEALIHQQSNHAYAEFRKQMLNQSNGNGRGKRAGGQPKSGHFQGPLSDSTTSSTNPSDFGLGTGISGSDAMTNGSGGEDCLSTSDDGYCGGTLLAGQLKNRPKSDEPQKDEAYWERRRKNNEAAKRSRDARRAKEDEIAIRAAFLEQENLKLRFEVCALKNETAKLRCMLYKSQ